MPRLLELFCGRMSVSKAFASRGWKCLGVDLLRPPEIPNGCEFIEADVLTVTHITPSNYIWESISICHLLPDFIWASSPCKEFSIHGMKHFHPNPKYPENGIKLFNHTRSICEASGVPYVMENVRAAQQFVGLAVNHCGPFYLWGSGVPPIFPQGIKKGIAFPWGEDRKRDCARAYNWTSSKSQARKDATAKMATIPSELAGCVADYATRILEQRKTA